MKQQKGVVTVFLVLILTIIITFLFALIDITRVNSARNQLTIASDAAITSALTNYHSELYENYGILAFEENEEIKDVVKKYLNENISSSGTTLFNINVEDENIKVKGGGNPFKSQDEEDSNQIIKEQMIYSMKYQGSENLVRSVYSKIKELLGAKNTIKETEDMKNLENNAKELNKLFEKVQKGKLAALQSIIIMAKNNKYEVLDNKVIGDISSIEKDELGRIYSSDLDVKDALESLTDSKYSSDVSLPILYTNGYVKFTLEIYRNYLNAEKTKLEEEQGSSNTSDNDGENNESTEINSKIQDIKKRIENIDNFILQNKRNNNFSFNNFRDQFRSELKSVKSKINTAIESVNSLLSDKNKKKIKEIIDGYNEIAKNEESKLKEEAEENAKFYTDKMSEETLKAVRDNLQNVYDILCKLDGSDESQGKFNPAAMVEQTIRSWNGKTYSSQLTSEINNTLWDVFDNNTDFNSVKAKIINSNIINVDESFKNAIKNYQIDTIEGINTTNIKMKKPDDNSVFKKFYDMFKDMLDDDGNYDEDKDKNGIIAILNNYNSDKSITSTDLPNVVNSEYEKEKLTKQLEKVSSLGGEMKMIDLLKAGGDLVDKLYLVEYVMTNFKEVVQPKEIEGVDWKRIPELTNNTDTVLNYEIEAIISGKYDDQESKNTLIDDLLTMRLMLNTVSFFAYQSELKDFTTNVARAVNLATGGIVPTPLVKYSMATIWIALETRADIIDLYNGYRVPLIKTHIDQWVNMLGLSKEDIMKETPEELEQMLNNKIGEINVKDVISKNENEPYNKNQKFDNTDNILGKIALTYADLVRFKLLIGNENELIDKCQDLISENMKLLSDDGFNYNNYYTDINVAVSESDVNILFKTPAFSSDNGKYKFKSFKFKKSYD